MYVFTMENMGLPGGRVARKTASSSKVKVPAERSCSTLRARTIVAVTCLTNVRRRSVQRPNAQHAVGDRVV